MENKELERLLVLHTHNSIPNYFDGADEGCDTCAQNILLRTVFTLADKQGYMRGVGEALRVLPKEVNWPVLKAQQKGFNECVTKAHDAISKLKKV